MSKKHGRGVPQGVDRDFASALAHQITATEPTGGHRAHKAHQLCRQVQRALNLALAERGSDAQLEGLYVQAVTPGAGGRSMLVHVVAPVGQPLADVLAGLRRDTPRLRAHVARAINRKRAPELAFVPLVGPGDV